MRQSRQIQARSTSARGPPRRFAIGIEHDISGRDALRRGGPKERLDASSVRLAFDVALTLAAGLCPSIAARSEGETIHPMLHAICLEQLTSKRVGEFQACLKCGADDPGCTASIH